MDNQRYKELDELCNKMEKLMTRAIEERLERVCKISVYYFFSHDEFSCEADAPYYNATISAGCLVPACALRDKSQDELRATCVNYAAVIAIRLEEAIKKYDVEIKEGT